jgi:hypothetical protein
VKAGLRQLLRRRPAVRAVPVCLLGRFGADTWGCIEAHPDVYGPETLCPVGQERRRLRAVQEYGCPGCSGFHGDVPQWARREILGRPRQRTPGTG